MLTVWLALAFAIVFVTASAFFAAARAIAAWRAVRRLTRKLGEAVAAVTRRVERIEDGLDGATEAAARLARANAQLQESLATARVLSSAFGEARGLLARFR